MLYPWAERGAVNVWLFHFFYYDVMNCFCSWLVRSLSNRRKTEEIPLDPRPPDFLPSFLLCCVGDIYKDSEPKPRILKDDVKGHLIYKKGDILDGKYEISHTLGNGTFGQVVSCKDLETEENVAVKIVRSIDRYKEAAKLETKVLKYLEDIVPKENCLFVRMLNAFEFQNHICLTFEQLGCSIYDFLKKNDHQPLPLQQVQHISHQICCAVKFLHDNKLIHTDLKPENILFVDSTYDTIVDTKAHKTLCRLKNSRIKLIDFGAAIFEYERHSRVISTRHYRAPEVILELGWWHACDVWSIACIMVEIYLGFTLFQTRETVEHLAMMEKVIGPFPFAVIQRSKTNYFSKGHVAMDATRKESARHVRRYFKPLRKYIARTREEDRFYDLLKCMFSHDPIARISLRDVLEHKFFRSLPRELRVSETPKTHCSCSRSRCSR